MTTDHKNNLVGKNSEYFEQLYSSNEEPWEYSKKAVEVLRHEFVVKTACSLKPNYSRILDVGCGKGRLTFLFNGLAPEILGIDVSKTAVQQAETYVNKLSQHGNLAKADNSRFHFSETNITNSSFPANHFDLILLCDGLEGWHLSMNEKEKVLAESFRLLMPGGFVILTDYLKHERFSEFETIISNSPLKIVRSVYLNDRFAYQFNSWFKMGEKLKVVQWIFANKSLAKGLMKISSLFGKRGSKHFCVIATKN
ncbi:MAG: class I SAM-dependent methyltransferase [Ignavibacteriales bacterium]|nr:MAG: class I SAM-dependent methyltransferase [Ignavibacteriales bacterium]